MKFYNNFNPNLNQEINFSFVLGHPKAVSNITPHWQAGSLLLISKQAIQFIWTPKSKTIK